MKPCRHTRCIHFEKQKKCKNCGRAYKNKINLLALPIIDKYITIDDFLVQRKKDIQYTVTLGMVTCALVFIMIAITWPLR